MTKISGFEVISILSALGMIGWMLTDFYGGMVIYALSYMIIIVPIVFIYLISFVETIFAVINKKRVIIRLLSHGLVLLSIIFLNQYNAEWWKSNRVLTAHLVDDLSSFELVLREKGQFENYIYGILGYKEVYKGKYEIKADTLLFLDRPYDNNFIPDTMLISRKDSAIFFEKDQNHDFRTEKEWLNHFKIQSFGSE